MIREWTSRNKANTASEISTTMELLNSGIAPPSVNCVDSDEVSGHNNDEHERQPFLSENGKTKGRGKATSPVPSHWGADQNTVVTGDYTQANNNSHSQTDGSAHPKSVHFVHQDSENLRISSLTQNKSETSQLSQGKSTKRLDQYGFITNLDSKGLLRDDLFDTPGGATTPPNDRLSTLSENNPLLRDVQPPILTRKEQHLANKLRKRRGKKWADMIEHWALITANPARYAKMRSRVRKGIPNSVRGSAWAHISRAVQRAEEDKVGVYSDLIQRSCGASAEEYDVDRRWYDVDIPPPEEPAEELGVTKETIERDINRTFPRHSMFYDSDSDSDSGVDSTDTSYDRISDCASDRDHAENAGLDTFGDVEVSADGQVIPDWAIDDEHGLDNDGLGLAAEDGNAFAPPVPHRTRSTKSATSKKGRGKAATDLSVAKGGQASLRRVLRAYSIYDQEVGYCQGMNFIAAMFITYVPEEQAFWLLVAVMKESPCQMRGLFSESMSEAHQVLFVAQKLIAQFLPRLSRHLAAENVDITMFATQWLLTMYTSSFPFDIVTRIWDCFLVEGWKVAYRAMIALLEGASADLLKLRFEDILGYLKDLPHRVDHGKLLEATFKIPLRKRHITKYAKQWEKALKEKEKKRKQMEKNGVV